MLTIVLLDVLLLVFLLMMSIPLPYCFGGALLFMSIFGGVSMKSMMLWSFSQIVSPILLASPLFVLAGLLMGESGIAKRLLDLADVFVDRTPVSDGGRDRNEVVIRQDQIGHLLGRV